MMIEKRWKSYEEVAAYLLNQMASTFGLGHVEGKQIITGDSGASWEIDAKGVKTNDKEAFVIVECRRYTTSRLKQEHLGGLAYRIIDTHAAGGIIITPLGLQEGAEKVAQKENIKSVIMREDSTTENYMLQFLNNIYLGLTEHVNVTEDVQVVIQSEVKDIGTGSGAVKIKRVE